MSKLLLHLLELKCVSSLMFVFSLRFSCYIPRKNDGLLYTKPNRYKMADGKTIDLQIPSLRSQPSEGSAAHPVILLADGCYVA